MTPGVDFGRVLRARLDREGAIRSADPDIARWQADAGGASDAPVAIPALARLVFLALRRGRATARDVVIADPEGRYGATALVEPDADGAALTLSDLRALDATDPSPRLRGGAPIAPVAAAAAGADHASSTPPSGEAVAMQYECDAALRLVALRPLRHAPRPPRSAWAGRSLASFATLRPDADGRFALLEAAADGAAFSAQAADLDLAPGDRRPFLLDGRPLLDGAGAFAGYQGALVEVAPAADEPRPAPLYADPEFGRRIDGALRGPLTRIVATASIMAEQDDGPLREDYARYARDIADAGRHLLGLVDDLSDLRMIERPAFTVAREAVDLGDIARRATGLLGVRAGERAVRFVLPEPDVEACATAEFRRTLQILLNLVGNAIAYGPEGGTVAIAAGETDETAWIAVADEGPGVPPADRERAFDKFERLGRGDGQGSGLGLYISRRLARAMRGDIAIDDAPGASGARFTLTLPRRRRDEGRCDD